MRLVDAPHFASFVRRTSGVDRSACGLIGALNRGQIGVGQFTFVTGLTADNPGPSWLKRLNFGREPGSVTPIGSSAECVVEAPGNPDPQHLGEGLPLTNFGTIEFDQCAMDNFSDESRFIVNDLAAATQRVSYSDGRSRTGKLAVDRYIYALGTKKSYTIIAAPYLVPSQEDAVFQPFEVRYRPNGQ